MVMMLWSLQAWHQASTSHLKKLHVISGVALGIMAYVSLSCEHGPRKGIYKRYNVKVKKERTELDKWNYKGNFLSATILLSVYSRWRIPGAGSQGDTPPWLALH